MPVIQIPSVAPLSSYWTVEKCVYEVRVLIDKLDNEVVQNSNIRYHLNSALSSVAEMVALHGDTSYGVVWSMNIETVPHSSGLPFVSLATLVPLAVPTNVTDILPPAQSNGMVVPFNLLWTIDAVKAAPVMNNALNTFQGKCKKVTLEQILELQFTQNSAYRQSVCYSVYGSDILFYFGYDVQFNPNPNGQYQVPDTFVLFGKRNPILDDLVFDNNPLGSFRKYVDLPDRYIRLLVLLASKSVMMQLQQQVPPDIDNQIAQLTQMITGTNNSVEQSIAAKKYNIIPNDGQVMR